jgi:hypothetical protein
LRETLLDANVKERQNPRQQQQPDDHKLLAEVPLVKDARMPAISDTVYGTLVSHTSPYKHQRSSVDIMQLKLHHATIALHGEVHCPTSKLIQTDSDDTYLTVPQYHSMAHCTPTP